MVIHCISSTVLFNWHAIAHAHIGKTNGSMMLFNFLTDLELQPVQSSMLDTWLFDIFKDHLILCSV
jgi:hypothetical protein